MVAHDLHTVANGNRIGTPDAFQPEIALYLAVNGISAVSQYSVPTASVLDNQSFGVRSSILCFVIRS